MFINEKLFSNGVIILYYGDNSPLFRFLLFEEEELVSFEEDALLPENNVL